MTNSEPVEYPEMELHYNGRLRHLLRPVNACLEREGVCISVHVLFDKTISADHPDQNRIMVLQIPKEFSNQKPKSWHGKGQAYKLGVFDNESDVIAFLRQHKKNLSSSIPFWVRWKVLILGMLGLL